MLIHSLGKRKKGDGETGTAHFTHLRWLLSLTLSLLGKHASRSSSMGISINSSSSSSSIY